LEVPYAQTNSRLSCRLDPARPVVSRTQEKTEPVLSLTLEDTILRTLKNNYGVAIQVMNPEITGYTLARAKEKFLPTLGFGVNNRSNESASYSWLETTGTTITDYYDYDASVSQLVRRRDVDRLVGQLQEYEQQQVPDG